MLNFRLGGPERATLFEVSKLYGAPSVSEFLREMVGAICSGDMARIQAFNVKLFERVGGQLALQLTVPAAKVVSPVEKTKQPKRAVRRKRRPRARAT